MNIIQLNNRRYECRVVDGERQVKYNGVWIPAVEFVDELLRVGDMKAVVELAGLGKQTIEKQS